MSSIKPEKPRASALERSTVAKYRDAFNVLQQLVLTCRTPEGRIKILQNTNGGNKTVTTMSQRLLQALSITKPVIQLQVSATQGHLLTYKDGGLFVLGFASTLVQQSLDSSINPVILAEIFEALLTFCTCHMESLECSFRFKAAIADIHFMVSFVKSVIQPKIVTSLNNEELTFIAKLVLEVFLTCINEGHAYSIKDSIMTLSQEGCKVLDSKVMPGVVIHAPELPRFVQMDLTHLGGKLYGCTDIRCVIVTASMSGDYSELDNVGYTADSQVGVDEECVANLEAFCQTLVSWEVKLLLCQRVVHPQLKVYLKECEVLVVDRIGLQPIKYLAAVTGCVPIQSADVDIPEKYFGCLDKVQHIHLHGKSYLQLTRACKPVTSLFLGHQHEQPLQELVAVCDSALASLEKLLYEPHVFPGAGCWQGLLAQELQSHVSKELGSLVKDMECPPQYITEAADIFLRSLLIAALGNPSLCALNSRTHHVHRSSDVFASRTDSWETFSRQCLCNLTSREEGDILIDISSLISISKRNTESSQQPSSISTGHSNYNKIGVEFKSGQSTMSVNPHLLKQNIQDSSGKKGSMKTQILGTAGEGSLSAVLPQGQGHVVMDSSAMCIAGLQTATLSACSLLKIGQILENF